MHRHSLPQPHIEAPPPLNRPFTQLHPTNTPLRHATRRTAKSTLADADGNQSHNIPQLSEHRQHERASTVIATLFYRWLPTLFSARPIRHTFTRNLDNAIRGVISVAVAAVIAVHTPWSINVLSVPYLFVVVASVTLKTTVGGTLMTIDMQSKGVFAAVVLDTIIVAVRTATLSQTHRAIVVELLLFVTSIGLAYYFHPPLSRRFALGLHALLMIEIALGADQVLFPLKTFLNFVLAYCVALILMMLPFPRLARDELLDRYQQSLLTLSDVFDAVVQCYLSTEPIAPQVLQSTGSSQLDRVFKSLTVMRRLKMETTMECSFFSLFPSSITVGCPVLVDLDRIEQLYWISTNLFTTLTTLHYSSSHAAFIFYLRDAFRQLSREQSIYLQLLGSTDTNDVTQRRVDDCTRRLDEAMAESWHAYTRARFSVYGFNASDADKRQQRPALHDSRMVPVIEEPRPAHRAGKGQEMDHRSYPADDIGTEEGSDGPMESLRLLVKEELQSDNEQQHTSNEPAVVMLHTTMEVFQRQSFFFYLTRFHRALQLLPLDKAVLAVSPTLSDHTSSAPSPPSTSSPTASSSSPPPPSSSPPSSTTSSWPRKRFALRRLYAELRVNPLSWSLLGLHPVRDFLSLFTTFGQFVRHPSIDWLWLRGSVKVSFIVCVASLIAVIPQIGATTIFPNAFWAAFTAGLLASDNEGALFQQGMYRIFGTLLGGLIGYLILYAFPHDWYGSIPLVTFWCFCMQFLQNSSYNLLGMLAAFTPIVIVFGYRLSKAGGELTVERYALVRMEEISIGVLVTVLISSLLWPVSSIRLLRSEMMVSVESFKAAVGRTMEIYDELVRHERPMEDTATEGGDSRTAKNAQDRDDEEKKAGHERSVAIELQPTDRTKAQTVHSGATGTQSLAVQPAATKALNEQCSQPPITPYHHCRARLSKASVVSGPAHSSFMCCAMRALVSVGHSAVLLEQRADVAITADSTAGRGGQRADHSLHSLPSRPVPAAIPHTAPHLVPDPHSPSGPRERHHNSAVGSSVERVSTHQRPNADGRSVRHDRAGTADTGQLCTGATDGCGCRCGADRAHSRSGGTDEGGVCCTPQQGWRARTAGQDALTGDRGAGAYHCVPV